MLLMCCLCFLTLSPLHMLFLGKGTFAHANIVARSHFGGLLDWKKKCLLISGLWRHYIIAGLLVNGLICPLRKGAPCISLILWPSVSCHLKRNEKQQGWFWVWFQCFARFRDIELFPSSAFILGNRTPTIVGGLDLLSWYKIRLTRSLLDATEVVTFGSEATWTVGWLVNHTLETVILVFLRHKASFFMNKTYTMSKKLPENLPSINARA